MKNSNSSPRLLIVGPAFFNYLDAIKSVMQNTNITTKILIEREDESTLKKVIYRTKFLRFFFFYVIRKRHKEIYKTSISFNASHVLFISPESMSKNLLINLKKQNIKTLLYMWDSFKNKIAARKFVKLFDECATFDPVDAKNYNIPLINLFAEEIFFIDKDTTRKFDFAFIGTAHSSRPKNILELNERFSPPTFNNKIHLYRGNVFYFLIGLLRTFFKNPNIFTKESISKEQVAYYFKSSKYVLDITHPKQNGLTSRSFEALSSGAFLVTNNIRAKDLIPEFANRIITYKNISELEKKPLNFFSEEITSEKLYILSIHRFCDDLKRLIN